MYIVHVEKSKTILNTKTKEHVETAVRDGNRLFGTSRPFVGISDHSE
jgi:hypothetical protein